MKKFKIGNWYRVKDYFGHTWIGQYAGREEGFECSVCGKGNNAHCFNSWYCKEDFETLSFGTEHLPEIIEDLGTSDDPILDK